MAISYVNSWTNNTPANPLSVAVSTSANQTLIAFGIDDHGSPVTWAWSAGFNTVANILNNDIDGSSLGVSYKTTANGSEGNISISNGASNVIGGVLAFSGVDQSTPLDVTPVSFESSVSPTSPWTITANITPTSNGCVLVVVANSDANGSVNVDHSIATTAGNTGSWTKHIDIDSGLINGAAFSAPQTTAEQVQITVTGTGNGFQAERGICIIALRPAAGGGTPVSVFFNQLRQQGIA